MEVDNTVITKLLFIKTKIILLEFTVVALLISHFRCSAPEEMKNVKFQDLLNNKTRLKCVDEKHDTIVNILKSSITVPAVVGFFSGIFNNNPYT